MNASRRRWAVVGLVAVVAAAIPMGSYSAAGPREPAFELRVSSGLLSMRASGAPLADVLLAVGREAHLKIVLHGAIDSLVTDTFVNVPLDEAVRRLTRWHSVLLVYTEPGDVSEENLGLTEVWVMSAGAAPAAREHTPDRGDVANAPTKDLRQMATTDPSPGVRQTALQKLARQPGVDAVKELREAAIRDPEPLVRQAAIRALASIRSAEAGDALRLMLDDSDPDIRELASHVLARWRQTRIR